MPGTARCFVSSSDVGQEIKIALIKSAGSHRKCFGGWELNTAPITHAARTGPKSIGSDSGGIQAGDHHQGTNICLPRSGEGFGVSQDGSAAKTTKSGC